MQEAALFLVDWFIADPDDPATIVTAPSTSPENTYIHPNGYHAAICKGSAMDIEIARALFEAVLSAAEDLSQSEEAVIVEIRDCLHRLPEQRLQQDGALQEFGADLPGAEEPHRHISQLFGLSPGNSIDRNKTPKLADGARKVLRQKGLVGTGWALAWRARCWARLGHSDEAHAHIKAHQSPVAPSQTAMAAEGGGVYPNMLNANPPFQIDANFGICAAMLDMLVQADEDRIDILPACPASWNSGTLRGVRLPGGYVIDLSWCENEISGYLFGQGAEGVALSYRGDSIKTYLLAKQPAHAHHFKIVKKKFNLK